MSNSLTRRRFIAALAITAGLLAARPAHALARQGFRGAHPKPRRGIDASRVVPRSALRDRPKVAEAFDMVREIPHVVDGIRCYCGCADLPESYSLLSCFEGDGMAQSCHVCQAEARLAHRMHSAGRSLEEIRDAIDAQFA